MGGLTGVDVFGNRVLWLLLVRDLSVIEGSWLGESKGLFLGLGVFLSLLQGFRVAGFDCLLAILGLRLLEVDILHCWVLRHLRGCFLRLLRSLVPLLRGQCYIPIIT